LMFLFFFSRSLFDSRFIIIAGWVFSVIFVIVGRGLIRKIQKYFYSFEVGVHRVAIIGSGNITKEVILSFQNNKKAGFKVVKVFEDFSKNTETELEKMAQNDKIDEILVATSNLSSVQLSKLNDFSYLNHVDLKYVADIFDFPIANFEIMTIAGLPVIEVKKTRLDGWGRIYKRIFDIIVSLILIILLSPILLIISLAVKLTSKGQIFFSYKRIGQQGKPFTYFKFRSMIDNAHKFRFDPKFLKQHQNLRKGTPMVKFKDDPRVTKVGKVLRKLSLDELPELFNVFIGKMSLVGPRPHEVEEVARYETFHKKVLTIKPGMTGMAQVSGRSDLDFNEEVRLDVWYMENWSLRLDLSIIFRTPFAVLKKRKAE
ncbi:MAG: sugar transferase, partial [Patescibacteria group bacterium]